jgi:alpha-1,3-fucosyltransferase
MRPEHHLDANVFNFTMTHRLDSDIPYPYSRIINREVGGVVAPNLKVSWRRPPTNYSAPWLLDTIRNKTKFAAWFVSQCHQPSHRMNLTVALQSYGIEVDIFGKCGNRTLSRYNGMIHKMLRNHYKFYFAFENSLCDDYVTEKLFKVMDSYVIPVVYSGAEMSRFAPPMSYVDANSFKTAEDLAKHLKFLAENPEEYAKYFWWRKHYKIRTIEQFDFDAVHRCRICQKFNDPYMKFKQQVYTDIYEWFHHGSCKEPSIKF